jgi:signal transduction histidine kinase
LTLLMEGMWRLLERKRAEHELKAEKANLDALFESSPVAMFVVDETLNIVMTNQAFAVMCGASEADILQHQPGNALRCVHSHKDPRGCGHAAECKFCNVRNGVEGLIANGGSLHGAELELELTRNEEPKKYWMSIGVEPFVMNERKRWCIAMDDVTERKRAEEKLRSFNVELEQRVRERTVELDASTKELEAFSYSVSHDLRAPLRAIDGFGHALLEDCEAKLDADGKDHLRRIRAATQRMGTLIDDLLRLSRLTRTEMLVEKVNLTELAWSVINELQKSEPERVVRIEIAEGLEVTADPKLMRIALENLLGNAWKFTAKRSEATIELGSTNEGAKTTYFVRDNGAGFDMAYVGKLFTPFQRLHSIEEYPGTGIGLGTVQRIMNRHGGRVWAEGQVDRGAAFHFSFQQ